MKPVAHLILFAMVGAIVGPAAGQDRDAIARPDLDELQEIVRPPSISGLASHGNEIWGFIYPGRGRYALLDRDNQGWRLSESDKHHAAINEAAGAFGSPGGACFAGDMLWIAGSYGDSIACIDTRSWRVVRSFRGEQRDDASQSYSGIAYDGDHLWVAWHWFKYSLPVSETQLLLKLNPETGDVVASYPLPPGSRRDGTHGLTWDGARLWHVKDARLSRINSTDGTVEAQYALPGIRRPSGLTWTDGGLFIAEFSGKVWWLPFTDK
jgi:hypothetical protein